MSSCVTMPKFVPIGQTVVDGDFLIFQVGGRHLVFSKFENFNGWNGQEGPTALPHHMKFHRNRSNRGRDMTILRFFKMAPAAILDF